MKWFKHYENATSNRFIQALISEHGLENAMRYWLLLEALCKEFKKDTTEFIFSEAQLKEIFKIKFTKKLVTFIQLLNNFSATFDQKLLNFSELSNNFWKIETPIMLELIGKEFKRTRIKSGISTPKKKEERRKKENKETLSKSAIPLDEITILWNKLMPEHGFPHAHPSTLLGLKARSKTLETISLCDGIGDFEKVFKTAISSKFLKGEGPRKWRADLSWIIDWENFSKLLNGVVYDITPKATDYQKEELAKFAKKHGLKA